MLAPPYPEVLAAEFVPPTLLARSRDVDALLTLVGGAVPVRPAPWAASVRGPPGSGTSSVARVAAHRLVEAIRRERSGPTPLLATVRVRWCRGAHGVAAALLQHLDEGFRPSGFHVAEIMAGFLRRLARDGRPVVVVLDDIAPSGPELLPVFRALAIPQRYLPEGMETPPPAWVLLAGASGATGAWTQAARAGLLSVPPVRLEAYDAATVTAIVRDRVARAYGRDPPPRMLERLTRSSPGGLSNVARTMDSVRRQLLGHAAVVPGSVFRPAGAEARWTVEPRLVAAVAHAAEAGQARLGDIRDWEARLALRDGMRPMATTTLWRRLLRLEAEGLVRRDVRPGGGGGTLSVLTVLRPFPEWPASRGPDNPRAAAPSSRGPSAGWPAGAGSPPPLPRPPWTGAGAAPG